MIVNTAYPYMKKIAPSNPIIFNGNVVNYKYEGSATLTSYGFNFVSNNNVAFYNVNCKKRTSLAIVGESNAMGFSQSLTVTFMKNGEQTGSAVSFQKGTSTKTVAIPAKYQTDDITVIFSTGNLPAQLLLKSATLS